MIFLNNLFIDSTKNPCNQHGSSNVTYTTARLPKQMLQRWAELHFLDSDSAPVSCLKTPASTPKNLKTSTLASSFQVLSLFSIINWIIALWTFHPWKLKDAWLKITWFISSLVKTVLFKENVRYSVWTCRDPISLILGIRFFSDSRDPIFNSRDPNRIPNRDVVLTK